MPSTDFYPVIAPALTGIGGLLVLLIGVWPRLKDAALVAFYASIVLLLGAMAVLLAPHEAAGFERFISLDPVNRHGWLLFTAGGLATLLLAWRDRQLLGEVDEQFCSLVLFAVTGTYLLSAATNLLAAFIGMELTALSVMAMIAWQPQRKGAIEAAIKYAITATVSGSIMLFGIVLMYAGSGSLYLDAIPGNLGGERTNETLVIVGLAMVLVGIAFELAVAPFHCWLADVFQGSSSPVTAFIASVGKIAMLLFLLNLADQLSGLWPAIHGVIIGMVVLSVVWGNLAALRQSNLKRMLAYSSVAHFGYVLLALTAISGDADGNADLLQAAAYYGLSYAVMNMVSFAVIGLLSGINPSADLEGYRGMGRRYPLLGVALAIAVLSLAGIPPTAGFFAKLFVFTQALNQGQLGLVIIASLAAASSLFYYLRILVVFFSVPSNEVSEEADIALQGDAVVMGPTLVISLSTAAVLLIGLCAGTVLTFI
ncbi:oxidoreductase [Pokkaliibacter plantistimulans]|uniref:NADH-quinone oxidoreductase subunit N n=1 Tax=Proteobacteria bacterium 228 TaxID=2083153 RepID=A0A2S5KQM1_9PROT|nr:NADH-quinone oxidoreductase subunit N [Pokkaliibacter plantistimulans]PPC76566.1 oxidoreductase [Pokkaliibacter plantistimulans]